MSMVRKKTIRENTKSMRSLHRMIRGTEILVNYNRLFVEIFSVFHAVLVVCIRILFDIW